MYLNAPGSNTDVLGWQRKGAVALPFLFLKESENSFCTLEMMLAENFHLTIGKKGAS